jgi:hypothetical protein
MPGTKRHPIRRRRRGGASSDQQLELWLGVSHRGPTFESDDERRAVWFRCRDRLLEMFGQHGRRPQMWWRYEAGELGLRYPGYDHEQSYLYEHAQLSEAESAELIAFWRKQFARAQQPGFSYCLGPLKWVEGTRAQRELYRWADIPSSLIKKWSAERRRQARTIRKLEADAAPHDAA